MPNRAEQEALRAAIHSTPIIDNHAHPLLKREHLSKHALLTMTSEAHGDALPSTKSSLAHVRAVKQLSGILGCERTWDAVEKQLESKRGADWANWTRTCLQGIECVLVDDGLDGMDSAESYRHFDALTPGKSKRIVRIEPLVEELIRHHCSRIDKADDAFAAVVVELRATILEALCDTEVVGFKSVICYRTGLDIPAPEDRPEMVGNVVSTSPAFKTFARIHASRLEHPELNEYYVHLLAVCIRDSETETKKPIQFHTGLGDNDIQLTKASPAQLQNFIKTYPSVPMVLLHAGYPYTRELGYLAAMYGNVYADIGEVFPMVSRAGQEHVVRQILELCPWEKIMWSTDGHWFPETYFLAVVQMREVFAAVIGDMLSQGDVDQEEGVRLVEGVLFSNANRLYNLGLTMNKSTSACS
ncbi:amidohydrolase-domain-containing protein [Emericellopsis atlantica]|uniref:Amidohydrolase-domain-containing protein n=1 Tax=Emericellopsis atlantica TaxID=2614577 RepID=A0A9P8CME6_9HYPO|nr:amidohydrolase-domain-containing protein [Emericellopsis atlantica]KAG9252027.1 amidohydrolase-domain-containing protein [Emericellopsis atlantica]